MARTTKGTIKKVGKRFQLFYQLNGVRHTYILRDDKGEPVTTDDAAEAAADKYMSLIAPKNEEQRLRLVQTELQTVEVKAQKAEKDLKNQRATIANGWKLFMKCPNRPGSCKRHPIDAIPPHTTPANYQSHYSQFTTWLNKKHPRTSFLSEITPDIAAEYAEHLEKLKVSAGTFNKNISFFKMFFKTLLDNEVYDGGNPFGKQQRKDGVYNSKRELSREQIAQLINTADGELKILLAIGYYIGSRLGDSCTTSGAIIDELRKVMEYTPRKTQNTRRDKLEAEVKVGINSQLQQLLQLLPVENKDGYLLPRYAQLYLSGNDNQVNREITRHFRKNGIETIRPGTGTGTGKRAVVQYGYHSLRYSYVSHHAEAGTPAPVIQKNVSHASPAMTRHYTKISDRAAAQYAEALHLPLEGLGDDQSQAAPDEPERAKLHELADGLPVEKIREFLKIIEGL